MRRCKVRASHSGQEDYEAWFHAWSTDYEEYENGPGLMPVAIVEKDDGSVCSVYADLIKFMDRVELRGLEAEE